MIIVIIIFTIIIIMIRKLIYAQQNIETWLFKID